MVDRSKASGVRDQGSDAQGHTVLLNPGPCPLLTYRIWLPDSLGVPGIAVNAGSNGCGRRSRYRQFIQGPLDVSTQTCIITVFRGSDSNSVGGSEVNGHDDRFARFEGWDDAGL